MSIPGTNRTLVTDCATTPSYTQDYTTTANLYYPNTTVPDQQALYFPFIPSPFFPQPYIPLPPQPLPLPYFHPWLTYSLPCACKGDKEDDEDGTTLSLILLGIEKDRIAVSLNGNELEITVDGKRRKTFSIIAHLYNIKDTKVSLHEGILRIRLPFLVINKEFEIEND